MWYHSFYYDFSENKKGGITVRQPPGYVCTYYPNQNWDDVYWAKHPWWAGETLSKTQTGYTLTLKNATQINFEPGQSGGYVATTVLDERQCETSLVYDSLNRLTDIELPGGSGFALSYLVGTHGLSLISSVTSHDGRSVSYSYEELAHPGIELFCQVLTSVNYPGSGENASYTYEFHPRGQALPPLLKTAKDRFHRGPVDHIKYNYGVIYGMLSEERNLSNNELLVARVSADHGVVIRNGSGVETLYTADPITGGTNLKLDAVGDIETWNHDPENPVGRFVTAHIDGESNETIFHRDISGSIMQRCTPVCTVTDFKYDTLNRITKETITPKTGKGRVTHFKYSYPGGLTKKTYPDKTSEQWFYTSKDASRILLYKRILRDGGVEHYEYDELGRKTKFTDPSGAISRWEYHPSGLLKAKISPTWVRTEYEYDAFGNKTKETLNDGSHWIYAYDDRNNIVRKADSTARTWSWTFDSLGRKLSDTDPLGGVTTYQYDDLTNGICGSCSAKSEPTIVTSPAGRVTTYVFDAKGRKIGFTKGAGTPEAETTSWEYNAEDKITSITTPNGAIERRVYDEEDRMVSVVKDIEGLVLASAYAYDDFGNQTAVSEPWHEGAGQDPTVRTTTSKFDKMDRPVVIIDPCGAKTRIEYDAMGRRISVRDGLRRITTFGYDAAGRRLSTTYPDGSVTSKTYNASGQVVETIDQLGQVAQRSYDNLGRLIELVDVEGYVTKIQPAWKGVHSGTVFTLSPEGRKTRNLYDDLDRLIKVTTATGTDLEAHRSYAYDGDGNNLTITDELFNVTTLSYDALNRRVSSTDALDRTTQWEYQTAERAVVKTIPDGRFSSVVSDALGRTAQTFDAAGDSIDFTYDGLTNNKATLTDSKGNVTTWNYDACGQLVAKIYADHTTEYYKYDKAHQLTVRTKADGRKIRYTYSPTGRQLTITHPGNNTGDVIRTFDVAGRVLTESTAAARRALSSGTSYHYDSRGNAISEVQTIGDHSYTIGRTYDGDGNLAQLVYPDSSQVNYGYDARGGLASVTDQTGDVFVTYDRAANGLVNQLNHGNGTITNKVYDAVNQLTGIFHSRPELQADGTPDSIDHLGTYPHPAAPGMQLIGSHEYLYDQTGRRTSQTFANGGTDEYGYDLKDQVISATYGGSNPDAPGVSQDFAYDSMGNRSSFQDSGATTLYTTNKVNQYVAVNATTTPPDGAYTHDLNGNLLSDGSREFKWDRNNNLTTVVTDNGRSHYTYDAKSRRVATEDLGQTTHFIYDGWNVIAESVLEGASITPSKTYVWGTDLTESMQGAGGIGGLVASDLHSTGERSYFHYDGNGNVIKLTGDSARNVAIYRYDTFGKATVISGRNAEFNAYRYGTKPESRTTNLHYYGHRWYDAINGRWIKRDPYGEAGGSNLLNMVLNNPVNSWDYLGLATCTSKSHLGNKLNDGISYTPGTGTGLAHPFPEKPQNARVMYFSEIAERMNSASFAATLVWEVKFKCCVCNSDGSVGWSNQRSESDELGPAATSRELMPEAVREAQSALRSACN